MITLLFSVLDTEWPALLVAMIIGIIFVVIRGRRRNDE